MPFVHLHVHSQYSVLDGTADPDALAAAAAARGFQALALTDTVNLCAAIQFAKACKSSKIHPIFGAELHVQPEGVATRDPLREQGGYQVVALVENDVGWRNLSALITAAIFDGQVYKPRVDLAQLRTHRDGLILLTGGRKGAIGRSLGRNQDPVPALRALVDAVGSDRLYLELVDHGLEGQDGANQAARTLGVEFGVPTVVTNAVHMVDAADAPVHDLLLAIGSGGSLAGDGRRGLMTDAAWLKPENEMRALFPRDVEALDRTIEIAARCQYKPKLGVYHFPAASPPDPDGPDQPADSDANWRYFADAFPPPQAFGLAMSAKEPGPKPPGAGNLAGYFGWYAREGLRVRLQRVPEAAWPTYRERLEFEIQMVGQMGFPAYLLIVAEFINWSKDRSIPVGPGRGSAAGSLAAWAMRITDIDPIRYGLLFERFLNPERVSMPDIDVDFCQDRREEAIAHVRDKYGADYVSQIMTFGTLKAKAAVRDVARALDLSFPEADRLAKLIPDGLGTTLDDAIAQEERLRLLMAIDPKVRRVIELARAVEGAVRQTGVHAAGVVIADEPLATLTPLYRDGPDGGPVVMFDMKSAEAAGLIKFDFLGLKTLDHIRDTLDLVQRNHGVTIDLGGIDENDQATWDMLAKGDALGVFQLESTGMRELLTRLRPSSMDDMVALVALYRPGPLQSGMVDDFVDRKHGHQVVRMPHPALEPILASTYGTIVYQEQVMQIAQVLAGYSLGEADLLRRARGKKNPEEMEKQRERFVTGSVALETDRQLADEIFDLMAKFAGYGFNKSHSAAYGLISYQTAWLKAHYRSEFMAALMTIEAANTDKVLEYVLDSRRKGVEVLPVCLNDSERHFAVPPPKERPTGTDGQRKGVIRFGLTAVKTVGDGAIDALLEARRAAGGRFKDLSAVFDHVDFKRVNRRVMESLVKAGAMEFSGQSRATLLAGIDGAMVAGSRRQADRAAGQIGLFGGKMAAVDAIRLPERPEFPLAQKLAYEREVLGLYLTGHPMTAYKSDRERHHWRSIGTLGAMSGEGAVHIAGLVADVRSVRTRSGDRMAFVGIEDDSGAVECVFFVDAFTSSAEALESGEPVVVEGTLERRGEALSFRAKTARRLAEVRMGLVKGIDVAVNLAELSGDGLDRLRDALVKHRGSKRCILRLAAPSCDVEVDLPPVDGHPELDQVLAATFGREVAAPRL